MLNRGNKVIAVIGVTREQVRAGVAHARTAGESLPVWAWSAEPCEPVEGCARFSSGAGALSFCRDLRGAWPALSIVSWTGERKALALQLAPLFIPPFRVVAFNEAQGFFALRPASVLNHAGRRIHDSIVASGRRVLDWIGGIGQWLRGVLIWLWTVVIAALAVAAKPTAPYSRWAVKRRRGANQLSLPVEAAVGTRFVEIPLRTRAWPRRAVLKALETATEDFVVFRRTGDLSSAEPLATLAAQTNSFAAARQIAWSGWRDTVLHRHPFRALQPGEVSLVEAPHSTLIAMRRDMLVRFGVPRALTSGAALMQLYWQAAAAGMRSLVVGDGGPLTQEPAMELEDFEFALRQPRDLSPVSPESSRGNVAWSPAHTQPFRSRPRVLVVSPYLPFPLSHGGAVRIYNLCRALSDEVDFVLACFREKNEAIRYAELHEIFREVYAVDIDEKHADPRVPAQVAGYRNSAMAALVGRLCARGDVDLVQLEYTQMAEYREHAGSVPTILVEHDITFTLHRQLKTDQHRLWVDFEREALQCVDAVWTMSEEDRLLALQHGASTRTTTVVPNGVDLNRFRPEPRHTVGPRILFVGSFRHLPNLLAFKALRETIMPEVWKALPAAVLHVIAGPNPPAITGLDPRIVIDEFVEDVRPAYRECDLAVVPLAVSAGTNIKVLEAMACGRPVVSTAVGCQGLGLRDETDLPIREIGPEFAAAIVRLLSDAGLRDRLGKRARETAERRFGWDRISREALRSYTELLDARTSPHENLTAVDILPSGTRLANSAARLPT